MHTLNNRSTKWKDSLRKIEKKKMTCPLKKSWADPCLSQHLVIHYADEKSETLARHCIILVPCKENSVHSELLFPMCVCVWPCIEFNALFHNQIYKPYSLSVNPGREEREFTIIFHIQLQNTHTTSLVDQLFVSDT